MTFDFFSIRTCSICAAAWVIMNAVATASASDIKIGSLDLKKPAKIEQKPVLPKKIKLQKPAAKKPMAPAPVTGAPSGDSRGKSVVPKPIARPQLKKVSPGPVLRPAKSVKQALTPEPRAPGQPLQNAMIRPPSQPAVKGLEPMRPLPKPDNGGTSPLRVGTVSVDTAQGALRINPGSNLAKDLSAPDLKTHLVKPRIAEGIDRKVNSIVGDVHDRDGAVKGNLQGLSNNQGSSLSERAGVIGPGRAGSPLLPALNDALSGYSGPDPGARRDRTGEGPGSFIYRHITGIKGGKAYEGRFDDPGVKGNYVVVILTNSQANKAGISTEDLPDYTGYSAESDTYYATLIIKDGTSEEEKKFTVWQYVDVAQEDQYLDDDDDLREAFGGEESGPSSCDEPGADCRVEDPANGTLRIAEDGEGHGGPLGRGADLSPADGTLRVANQREIGGEPVRGSGVLKAPADGTLRMPEDEQGQEGGAPQVVGIPGGGPDVGPGVVTKQGSLAKDADNPALRVDQDSLNVDARAIEGIDASASR